MSVATWDRVQEACATALLVQADLNSRSLNGEKTQTYWDYMSDPVLLQPYQALCWEWRVRFADFDPARWSPERAAVELASNIRKTPMMLSWSLPSRLAMARIFMVYGMFN